MIVRHIRSTLRQLRRHKTYSILNILGLGIGLSCCLLILLFVRDELSYDRFHANADRIFRVKLKLVLNDVTYDEASLQFPAAEALTLELPEVDQAVRLYRGDDAPLVEYEDRKFTEAHFLFADSNFFRVFDFELLEGDPETALTGANAVVVTESTARRYFGSEPAVGKTLTYNGTETFEVTGVAADPPANSHFTFDLLASMNVQFQMWQRDWGPTGRHRGWFWNGAWTYILLSSPDAANAVSAKLPAFVGRHFPKRYQSAELGLQPLTEIYLHSDLGNELAPTSDASLVYIFSTIALLVLLIACINFANLATAQSMSRTREVAARKSVGADAWKIRVQFLGEALVMAWISVALALAIGMLLLPAFNQLTGKQLDLGSFFAGPTLVILIGLPLVVGLVSGWYPSMLVSRIRPAEVLKTGGVSFGRASLLQKGLVVFQFSLSIALAAGIGIIFRQIHFIASKRLGFDREQIVMVTARPEVDGQLEAFRSELIRNPGILNVTGMSDLPGRGASGYRFVPEGGSVDQPLMLPLVSVGFDFLETMGVELASGRGISRDFPADANGGFLLNETAARTIGWGDSVVGHKLDFVTPGAQDIAIHGKVIGVVKDYNFESLHHEIKPLVLMYYDRYRYYAVKLKGDPKAGLAHLDRTWNSFAPEWPIEYSFLDQDLDGLYSQERRLSKIVGYFAALALFVAFLGLFGLSAFTLRRRTKEISLRKVLGAGLAQNLSLLSREFVLLVVVSSLIGLPLAYYATTRWLENFAYKGGVEPWVLLSVPPVALLLALATVSFECLKVSMVEPIEVLRRE